MTARLFISYDELPNPSQSQSSLSDGLEAHRTCSWTALCAFAVFLNHVFCVSHSTCAQEKRGDGDPVAATVNGEQVYRSEVLRTFYTTLRGKHESLDATTRTKMLASVLDEVIDQRLVYAFLKQSGKVASEATVTAELKTIAAQLEKQKQDRAEYLKENGYTPTTFRRQIAWRLSWQAYLDATINDELLKKYFQSHLPEYDGSEVRASHILLRIDDQSSGESVQRVVDKARRIRQEIKQDTSTFAEAAKKYSDGPSRLRGGDIGFFPRYGVQGEAFSRAAFDLGKYDISDPVVTSYGVHLIQATEIRPGKKKWTDIKDRLRRDITRELFEKIAAKQRVGAKIEFTNAVPHFEN